MFLQGDDKNRSAFSKGEFNFIQLNSLILIWIEVWINFIVNSLQFLLI